MKAQYIYEKFREESDPVHDMGIGLKKLREQVKSAELFNGKMGGMDNDWVQRVLKAFNLPLGHVYFLADTQNNRVANISEIRNVIRKGRLIHNSKFRTSGAHEEICIFKLYNTSAGKIGTFQYEYNEDEYKSEDNMKQFIGTIEAVIQFNTKQFLLRY